MALLTLRGKALTCAECVACSEPGEDFIICKPCFEDASVHCNNRSHAKTDMVEGRSNVSYIQCPRVRQPPQDSPLFCSKCSQNVGRCYLHCCSCNESFDMCITCATKRKTCPGRGRFSVRTPHTLEICSRHIEA